MRPTPQTQRHTVIGEFRVDDGVPAEVLAALTSHERRVLVQWLDVFQASRASGQGPVELSIDQHGLGAIMRALDIASATLAPAEAETIRASLEAVSRTLRSAASARPGRSRRAAPRGQGQGDLLEALNSSGATTSPGPSPSDRCRARTMGSAQFGSPHRNG